MKAIAVSSLPDQALLVSYRDQGAYTDCYSIEVSGLVALERYIEAFYTTPLFRLERLILSVLVNKPSTDAEAGRLARGQSARFAAWTVEGRAGDQILLCDFLKRTGSWLMCAPCPGTADVATRLYFGSAVVPLRTSDTGRASFGLGFHLLKGFHRLYSRALLWSAVSALRK